MGSTASTAHRLEKRRAWYMSRSDDKMSAESERSTNSYDKMVRGISG